METSTDDIFVSDVHAVANDSSTKEDEEHAPVICTNVCDIGLVRWFTFQLLSGMMRVAVRSRSGVGTSIYVESSQKNTMTFDVGADIPDPSGINGRSHLGRHIFLTHTHGDHVLALGSTLLASQCRGATYHIWVPRSKMHRSFRALLAHLRASAALSNDYYEQECYLPQKNVEDKIVMFIWFTVLCMVLVICNIFLIKDGVFDSFLVKDGVFDSLLRKEIATLFIFMLGVILYRILLWQQQSITAQLKEPAAARVSFVHRNLIISEVIDEMVVSKQNRIVRAFPSFHNIESNAYVVYDKVCPISKYEGESLSGMYTDGTFIYAPVLTISGDTSCELWHTYPMLTESQIVLSEATRMTGDIEDARLLGHTHVQELVKIFWQCSHLILYHIACRETNAQIKEAVSKFTNLNVLIGQTGYN